MLKKLFIGTIDEFKLIILDAEVHKLREFQELHI
jgi:hypothetical protein